MNTSPMASDALGVDMPYEVERLRETIVEELRQAGVQLPAERLDRVVDVVLADAVGLALGWLEGR